MNNKLNEQDFKELNTLREQYSSTIFEIGRLQYNKVELEAQLKIIDHELTGLYSDIKTAETRQDEFLRKVRETYGEGMLDTQTGEIVTQS
jgi:mRNA-degrading endonuclease YafQ of YafQ-DinJ toxin-antitoxin module